MSPEIAQPDPPELHPVTAPSPSGEPRARVSVLGLEFDALTESETVRELFEQIENGRGGQVVTANLDHLRRAVKDDRYWRHVSTSDLVVADGMPIVWASRLRGRPLPERVTGADLVFGLCAKAAETGRSVFLLGGNPGAAEAAAANWVGSNLGLKIAGTFCPEFGFERDEQAMEEIRRMLADSSADIVLVGLGSPKQEYLIEDLRHLLPDAWWVGVGVSFSFVSGEVSRAPRWIQRIGFEWLHRLCCEPRRLARRYLVDGIPFALRLFCCAALARVGFRRLFDVENRV